MTNSIINFLFEVTILLFLNWFLWFPTGNVYLLLNFPYNAFNFIIVMPVATMNAFAHKLRSLILYMKDCLFIKVRPAFAGESTSRHPVNSIVSRIVFRSVKSFLYRVDFIFSTVMSDHDLNWQLHS